MAGEYLKNSTIFLAFFIFMTLTVTFLWSQDCQCSIYLYPRKSRKPRKPWFTLHRKITQHYRTVFTQAQYLRKTWQMLPAEFLLYVYICLIYILSSFKIFGEIIQFSQLLIQGLVDHFADFSGFSLLLPVYCSLSSLPEGEKEK